MNCGCAPRRPSPSPSSSPSSPAASYTTNVNVDPRRAATRVRIRYIPFGALAAAKEIAPARLDRIFVEVTVDPATTGTGPLMVLPQDSACGTDDRPTTAKGIPVSAGGLWWPPDPSWAGEIWAHGGALTGGGVTVIEYF